MQSILVAVDGSDNGFRALMKAKELGTAFKCKITILHVIDAFVASDSFNSYNLPGYDDSLKDVLVKGSEKLLDSYMEHFKDYPGEIDNLVVFGRPADEIIEISEKGDYCLIIVGSRGLGAFSRVMLGSVSNKVLNKSKIDVLAVQ